MGRSVSGASPGSIITFSDPAIGVVDPDAYDFQFSKLSEQEGGGWLLSYPDLPGCYAHGQTKAEALEKGTTAVKLWIKANEERGITVPKPDSSTLPSGHIRVRVPRIIHKRVALLANSNQVSINSFAAMLLVEGMRLMDNDKPGGTTVISSVADSVSSSPVTQLDTVDVILNWTYEDHDRYAGEWNQRLDPTLHHQLRFRAEEQGVSINSLIASLLASGVARREGVMLVEKHEARDKTKANSLPITISPPVKKKKAA